MRLLTNPSRLTKLNDEILNHHRKKDFRPIVVIVLINTNSQALLVQSAKDSSWWGFPQGGVIYNERINRAAIRELREETGIKTEAFQTLQYVTSNDMTIANWQGIDGFTTGKKYYYFLATGCDPNVAITLDTNEVTNYQWIPPSEADIWLSTTNEDKLNTLLNILTII